MSKWVALAAMVVIASVIAAAWYNGYSTRGTEEELKDAKANQEQLDERRESQNAVNRLDDTGLRDAIIGVPREGN